MSNKEFWLTVAIMFVAIIGLYEFMVVLFKVLLMIGGKYQW